MRIVWFLISGVITTGLILVLNTTWVTPAPLGKLLNPQGGIWQNAEPVDNDFSADLKFPQLDGRVQVYFDERLVPHVFADNNDDAMFVEGYLHAKFRLWQMEFQTHAAAGRISELIGNRPGVLNFDRNMRRLGMVYAAEHSLAEMEKDPLTRSACDHYTEGVNAYIASLNESTLPLEYKIMGYYPEKWTNLKTALFMKYMSYDLAGAENDFEYTNAKKILSATDFDKLYPIIMDSLDPIVPKGTVFPAPGIQVRVPVTADSLYYDTKTTTTISEVQPDKENGSNNWAVNGTRTKSGYPILCNDPHLALNLPSLWYEMQITTPSYNAYGVSFPGAPTIIIGFNDSCAFGFTNAGRDVRDYYTVRFRDDSRKEYWFDSAWHPTTFRIEDIRIKGQPDYLDTVAYTNIGPVMYDKTFDGNRQTGDQCYAVRWKAHDPSNELKMFLLLDRAKNYNDYLDAIRNLHTPGQNCIFACKNGDIAIWDQGAFPAKWKRQGDFVMPGQDSSYFWQGIIPQEENPHLVNPARGFVSSANQLPADTSYPYYLGGSFPPYRGLEINRRLSSMSNITPDDMMKLQTDNYDVFAELALPLLLKNINRLSLGNDELDYLKILDKWDRREDIDEKGATLFELTWDSLEVKVWHDEFAKSGLDLMLPYESTLLDDLLHDSTFSFLDDINTVPRETLSDDVTSAFRQAAAVARTLDRQGRLAWANYKDTHVEHLARLDAFSRLHLPIGGGTHDINAAKAQHGPSWRMVVSLTPQTDAYGVYPGGQSGNPGSRFYDNFVDSWVAGKYYTLWVMKPSDTRDARVKWKMTFAKS